MTRNILLSPEIAEILGQKIITSWKRGPYPDLYRCPVCHLDDTIASGTPTSVSVIVGCGRPAAFLQHARCAPSRKFTYGEVTTPFQSLPERHLCIVRREPKPKAVFVSVLEADIASVWPDSNDPLSLTMSAALAAGFDLVAAAPFSASPPLVRGWSIEVDTKHRAVALKPDAKGGESRGGALAAGTENWLDILRDEGECMVLIGTNLILEAESVEAQVEYLARLGRLAAGVVMVRWREQPGDSLPLHT